MMYPNDRNSFYYVHSYKNESQTEQFQALNELLRFRMVITVV